MIAYPQPTYKSVGKHSLPLLQRSESDMRRGRKLRFQPSGIGQIGRASFILRERNRVFTGISYGSTKRRFEDLVSIWPQEEPALVQEGMKKCRQSPAL
jgi:hypothetical protein